MTLEQFYKTYPKQSMEINGKNFEYRYYKKENAKATLVLLTGGIGLSDLFYEHFDSFAQDFSVITFDYLECYATMEEFADAVGVLLKNLDEKVWLVGQSLGGFVAQVLAKRQLDFVEGLVLSNTGSLAKDLNEEALNNIKDMVEGQRQIKKLIRILPFPIVKKAMLKKVAKNAEKLPEQYREHMKNLTVTMLGMLTKKYELHMLNLMSDYESYLVMEKKDFESLEDKVLLILSDDDTTFNNHSKQSLIGLMWQPTVVTDMGGGHLGALMQIDKYTSLVTQYIQERV